MKIASYFKGAFATTYNIILNALTLGRYVWLEGRVREGRFQNWARRFNYQPAKFIQPTTEDEIVDLVKNSNSLRLFGSGHSFNGGVLVDDTLVSLDRYSGVIWKDAEKMQMAVKGGTRVRDIIKELLDEGLAFAAQPSHDAQSLPVPWTSVDRMPAMLWASWEGWAANARPSSSSALMMSRTRVPPLTAICFFSASFQITPL